MNVMAMLRIDRVLLPKRTPFYVFVRFWFNAMDYVVCHIDEAAPVSRFQVETPVTSANPSRSMCACMIPRNRSLHV